MKTPARCYEHHGCQPLKSRPRTLFLALATAKKAWVELASTGAFLAAPPPAAAPLEAARPVVGLNENRRTFFAESPIFYGGTSPPQQY
jgi:hypothetical protein